MQQLKSNGVRTITDIFRRQCDIMADLSRMLFYCIHYKNVTTTNVITINLLNQLKSISFVSRTQNTHKRLMTHRNTKLFNFT